MFLIHHPALFTDNIMSRKLLSAMQAVFGISYDVCIAVCLGVMKIKDFYTT